jgi:hypothetical protein
MSTMNHSSISPDYEMEKDTANAYVIQEDEAFEIDPTAEKRLVRKIDFAVLPLGKSKISQSYLYSP